MSTYLNVQLPEKKLVDTLKTRYYILNEDPKNNLVLKVLEDAVKSIVSLLMLFILNSMAVWQKGGNKFEFLHCAFQ